MEQHTADIKNHSLNCHLFPLFTWIVRAVYEIYVALLYHPSRTRM